MNVLRRLYRVPLTRGMMAYAVSYSTSNIIAQTFFRPEQENINWFEVFRFSFFGSFWVAPTLYTWIKIASKIYPTQNLRSSMKKAVLEQFTYGPFAITTFYTGMNLLQGNDLEKVYDELSEKFLPTYQTGALYWATVQTINFALVPERNRVPLVSVATLVWGTFLSYMKYEKEKENLKENTIVNIDN